MHLTHRPEVPSADAGVRTRPKAPRPGESLPLLHLARIEDFGTHIHRKVLSCHSSGRRPAVMVVAIDVLEGGLAYDDLLSALGARVRMRVRSTDAVARIADRFWVYIDGNGALHAAKIRERLKAALMEDVGFGDVSARIRPRFGMALHAGVPMGGIDLVRAAEQGIDAGTLARGSRRSEACERV